MALKLWEWQLERHREEQEALEMEKLLERRRFIVGERVVHASDRQLGTVVKHCENDLVDVMWDDMAGMVTSDPHWQVLPAEGWTHD